MSKPIRVLIVDDSALVRQVLSRSLSHFADIEVIGTAMDPYVARDKILQLEPDVITLDIEMPRMDGITFLRLLMKHRPMPVIIMSSLTAAGSSKALEALRSGAIEVLEKPRGSMSVFEDNERLAEVIRAAARSRPPVPEPEPESAVAIQHRPLSESARRNYNPRQLILMGASTGGTEALRKVLTQLPGDLPGICIVQHIPAQFSAAFAQRLNEVCQMEVREARSGDTVEPGLALVAPGGSHLLLQRKGAGYGVILNEGPRVHYQRPAVDVLYNSAEKLGAAPHCLAVLLTGMGADGAAGMLGLRKAGAVTLAQDEASCVVYGMPKEAARMGAVQQVVSLTDMPKAIEHHCRAIQTRVPGQFQAQQTQSAI